MRPGRSRSRQNNDVWPGFVDALSTLLLSLIFILTVFVLGQFFLSQMLEGRDETVDRLEDELSQSERERDRSRDLAEELRLTLARLNSDLSALSSERDDLGARLEDAEAVRDEMEAAVASLTNERSLIEQALAEAEADARNAGLELEELRAVLSEADQTIAADKATIEAQLGELTRLRRDIEALATVKAELESDVGVLAAELARSKEARDDALEDLGTARDRAAALESRLADVEEQTVLAQREIEARDLRIEELSLQATRLAELESDEARARADAERDARTLRTQIEALSEQLVVFERALADRESEIEDQNETIADLGARLNLALANRVEELSRARSDFFGRLREVLGDREDVRIVGDRFVFQSEVLFGSGEAEIGAGGRAELAKLAEAFRQIMAELPEDLPWVVQVDGHTDIRPINTPRFPSNWELSTARAISVARFLVEQGIPADRVAARGFAEFQPLDTGNSTQAFRRNRRIEIKLTTR